MNGQQGPISILRNSTHQSRQQQVSIVEDRDATRSGRGGRGGQGGRRPRTNKHTKGNGNPNSKPPPTTTPRKDKIHHFTLTYSPKVLEAKTTNVKTVIQGACSTIFKKTGCKATFFSTTEIQPPPQPIKNITTDFPSTPAELQDSFQVYKASSRLQVKMHVEFTMPVEQNQPFTISC